MSADVFNALIDFYNSINCVFYLIKLLNFTSVLSISLISKEILSFILLSSE